MDDASAVRKRESGIELGERLEDERSLGEPRVRHGEPRLVDRLVAVEEKVEVDRPRPEPRPGALAPERALDREQPFEELPGREIRLDEAGGVQKPRLVDVPDRIGLPEPGDRDDADVGAVEQLERAPEAALTVAEVGPEADVRARQG